MNKTKRPYDSTGRRVSAEQRKGSIIRTARDLFQILGYGATTIEQIASHAAVAVPTIYSAYGSKPGLLKEMFLEAAAWYRDSADYSMPQHLRDPGPNVRKQLRQQVFLARHYHMHTAQITDYIQGAASSEKDLLTWWKRAEKRRLNTLNDLPMAWRSAGALRPNISNESVLDILGAMTSVELYRLFIVERRWPPNIFEAWLGDTLESLLFA